MTGSPQVESDLDALLRRVARQDVDAFAAFYDYHPGTGVRIGEPGGA